MDPQVAVEEDDGGLHFAYGDQMVDRPSGRHETEEQRLDRNLGELLQELRVALPGVQVLFAFLLAVPFQQNFTGSPASSVTSTSRPCSAPRSRRRC